ncbi:MAG: 2Fe-2S iron-sulfur cluster-binding protein [Bdellovibrionales bacterium]
MKVKFLPQDVEHEIQPGQTVMELAHAKGIVIRSTCNGIPSCAECRIRVTDGDWNVNPPSRKELNLIGTGYYIDQRRLSCQLLCFGDITVDTSEQIEKSSEGPVTKKFLTKVHKSSADESHSVGGVLIEQDEQLLHELKKDVPDTPQPAASAGITIGSANGRGNERANERERPRDRIRSGGERGDRAERGERGERPDRSARSEHRGASGSGGGHGHGGRGRRRRGGRGRGGGAR